MKLIKPSVKIIEQAPGEIGMYKHIEYAMRTCYASRDLITDDSYEKMLKLALTNKHHSVLEHGTVYLAIPRQVYLDINDTEWYNHWNRFYFDGDMAYITTNYRVLVEHNWEYLLQYMCEPTALHEKRITVNVITSIGISREWNRHRSFSISEQSTRYCNFSKDKFDNEVTFVIPSWCKSLKESTSEYPRNEITDEEVTFLTGLVFAESCYLKALEEGRKPQEARDLLPLATKTEVVYTGFISDWEHFFELRRAENAHPDIKLLADELYDEFKKRGYIQA